MSQNEINLEPQHEPTPATTQTLGQWLIAQRQAQGLSAQDVASRTNRNLQQIMAIEADDYSSVNAPVLLRAVVRHYAKAIGVDSDIAVSHLPEAYRQATAPAPTRDAQVKQVFSHSGKPMQSPWMSRSALALIALVVFGLLAYWMIGSRFTNKADGAKKISEPNQVQVVATTAAPTADTANAAANAPAATTSAPAASVADELQLKFKANSWVEIKDADGKILLSGEQLENTEQTLTGKLPLKVKVGNATHVEALWKGAAYDLTPTIKGGVARLTLE